MEANWYVRCSSDLTCPVWPPCYPWSPFGEKFYIRIVTHMTFVMRQKRLFIPYILCLKYRLNMCRMKSSSLGWSGLFMCLCLYLQTECARWSKDGWSVRSWRPGILPATPTCGALTGEGHPPGVLWRRLHCLCHWLVSYILFSNGHYYSIITLFGIQYRLRS